MARGVADKTFKDKRVKLIDKYIRLERQLDTASDRRGRTITEELGRLEIVYGITTDEVKRRRKVLREMHNAH